MIDLGTVRPGRMLYIPFATYDSNDPTASVTMTGFAVTDIEIYKDGSTTQRASDNGVALLDTDGTDFDGLTGIHGFSINLADNSTAGFYAAGSQYWAVVSSVTVDAGVVSFVAATWRIGFQDAVINTTIATLASQTSFTLTIGAAENNAYVGCPVYIHDVASAVQGGFAVISAYTGSTKTVTLAAGTTYAVAATDNISIFLPSNARWFGATSVTGRDLGSSVLLSSGTGTGQVSLASGAVTVGTNNDKTGYTASTVSDKTGYSLTATTGLGNQTANLTGNLSGSVGSVTGAVGSVTGAVGGNVTGSVGSVATGGITSGSFATGAITATAIAADAIGASELATDAVTEIANAIAALTIDSGMTLQNAMKLVLAAAAGKVSGASGTTVTIRDTSDTYNRIVATVDADGNRSALTYVTT